MKEKEASTREKLKRWSHEASKELKEAKDHSQLDDTYKSYLGKKGLLSEISKGLKNLPIEERRDTGQMVGEYRNQIESLYQDLSARLTQKDLEKRLQKENYDLLRPFSLPIGRLHPLTIMQREVEDIFSTMGFEMMDGPELETDEYNFERLNFSKDHPARDMQDTIWTEDGRLLRTHTSAVQVRAMEIKKPPFRILAHGRCFRYEETDSSHETTFHQIEGMMVDRVVSVAHLIYVMKILLSRIFDKEVKVRLRPGYFPFVEPGFELDMFCLLCAGKGCSTCRHSCWIELLPCGLVHPQVLRLGGISPNEWSGFAFGLGLDRLVMMRYGVEDIRRFLSGNLRFLNQF